MSQYPLQSSQQSSTQGLQDFIDSRNMLESPAYFFRFSYVLVCGSTKDSTLMSYWEDNTSKDNISHLCKTTIDGSVCSFEIVF